MFIIRKSLDRGHFDYGWLSTYHTFSFSAYYDPKHVSFRSLRVINEDIVVPNEGFDTHPHKDMEIITYIIDGELTHTDSTGTASKIRRGDVQVMTAGTGVEHSEYNRSSKPVHLLQVWITPEKNGLKPSYAEKNFPEKLRKNSLYLIVSDDGASLKINQDVKVYSSILEKDHRLSYNIQSGRGAWIQVISGELHVQDMILVKGDGVSIEDESHIGLLAKEKSEFLLFDLG